MPSHNLRGRLEKLERNRPATTYQTPVIFYDASDPAALDQQQTAAFARAWSEGWRPESEQPLAFFMPENNRPHPGRNELH